MALAAPLAAAPAKPVAAANRNWLNVVSATPEGGFRMGNPDAKVKLVEYGSLTCPHCAQFHADAMDKLKASYLATGKVSYEFRNFVLNGPDYAASLLARCKGAQGFFPLANAFFSKQSQWTEAFSHLSPADSARLAGLAPDKQVAALADIGKLDAFVAPLGINRAKFDACLADKVASDKLLSMRKDAVETWKLTGTPGLILNGKTQDGAMTWEAVEPLLQAALR